jgi:hypothetical protein
MTRTAKIALVGSTILLLILLTTDPRQIPSVVLVAPFLLIFVIVTATVAHLLGLYSLFERRRVRVGIVCAAIPVLLLVLQSLGQLTLRDTLALFALFAVAYFYISRLGVRPTN